MLIQICGRWISNDMQVDRVNNTKVVPLINMTAHNTGVELVGNADQVSFNWGRLKRDNWVKPHLRVLSVYV